MALSGREMLVKTLMQTFGLDKTLTEGLLWSIETVQGFDTRLNNIERGLSLLLAQQQSKQIEAQNDKRGAEGGGNGSAADHARD